VYWTPGAEPGPAGGRPHRARRLQLQLAAVRARIDDLRRTADIGRPPAAPTAPAVAVVDTVGAGDHPAGVAAAAELAAARG
jgi:sugar/nucleoside kinase (ribokinase family)